MKTIQNYTDEEIRHGIIRCEARLSGVMPLGLLSIKRTREALISYKNELVRRGIRELDFTQN